MTMKVLNLFCFRNWEKNLKSRMTFICVFRKMVLKLLEGWIEFGVINQYTHTQVAENNVSYASVMPFLFYSSSFLIRIANSKNLF
jgi:hypothetical protein